MWQGYLLGPIFRREQARVAMGEFVYKYQAEDKHLTLHEITLELADKLTSRTLLFLF